MSNSDSSQTSDDYDEYPEVTQADLDRSTFRVGLKPVPREKRVPILLDTGLVEYFKSKAGEGDVETLINETLRQAWEREALATTLRKVLREELHRDAGGGR